uniref:GPI ethanolamine phosphate transferase 3 n=1 Tax=Enterobius vermicularis TaxID=51028 RepID=A0A0N4VFJ6_ENTVE
LFNNCFRSSVYSFAFNETSWDVRCLIKCFKVPLLNLLLICLSFFAALVLFQCGFLLKRHEISSRSNCSDVSYTRGACWLPAQYKRAILIVIDALRYDFAAPPHYSQYSGHLPIITELLSSDSGTAALTRFIADPPTTTLQRLKGLTTGSLPTFIDVASNFASSEIQEDNWVDQVYNSGRNITFLGDDTWMSLFPSRFHRSFHLPSFDINDLNGVDNLIIEHVYDELSRSDWDVLIAHFLGVDHCGHKYGPNHPEMIVKLSQMNDVIRKVVEIMDRETLLLVLGDHGMTETGDHGGDAQLELDAALFIYSKKRLLYSSVPEAVSQVDLVPTLSLLLDSPIPFSNIGIVIDSLIPNELRSLALSSNVWQMDRYAHIMADEIPDLYGALREFEAKEESDSRNLQLMRKLQQLFRFSWTRFSHPFMRVGLESMIEAIFGTFDAYFQISRVPPGWVIFRSALFFIQMSAYLSGGQASTSLAILEIILVSSLLFHFISLFNKLLSLSFSIRHTFAVSLIVIHGLSFLSNSFIVFESSSVRFLTQTALISTFVSGMQREPVRKWKRSLGFRSFFGKYLSGGDVGKMFAALISLRLGRFFERCREEQQSSCSATFLAQSSGKLQGDYEKLLRFVIGAGFLIGQSIFFKRTLFNFSPFLSSLVLPTAVSTIAFWLTQLLPEKAAENFTSFSLFASRAVPAMLIICHLFSSHIIIIAALPYSIAKHVESDPFFSPYGLIRRSSLFLLLYGFQVLCICVAAFVHRRHLMVWKIFAPKFVFESVSLLVVCITLVLVNLIFRNMNQLRFIRRGEYKKSSKLK